MACARIDRLLNKALDRGTILYGGSAGGIRWFDSGLTDSLSFDGTLQPLHNGLGYLAGSHAPHFDQRGRADAYASMIADGQLQDGIGIDDFAAAHFSDGEVVRVVAARSDATAHFVTSDDTAATISPLPARIL